MSPISIEDASPGWLTKKQIALITKKHGLTDENGINKPGE
ncbi:hypothetical protein BGP_6439 [Beggiatoa sp. PS]|nr:hypothetical protein BGP_6439 [Beggiatoa sp. PS]